MTLIQWFLIALLVLVSVDSIFRGWKEFKNSVRRRVFSMESSWIFVPIGLLYLCSAFYTVALLQHDTGWDKAKSVYTGTLLSTNSLNTESVYWVAGGGKSVVLLAEQTKNAPRAYRYDRLISSGVSWVRKVGDGTLIRLHHQEIAQRFGNPAPGIYWG